MEFVSANPTGPITVASGAPRRVRGLALPDPRVRRPRGGARVLRERRRQPRCGASASRSGRGPGARSRPRTATTATTWPSWPAQIEGAAEMDLDELARRGIELILSGVRASLARLRVHMDRFSLEHELHDRADRRVLGPARRAVYESEGATWLRTTDFGDDKDRVLRRSTGELTYFARGHRLPRGQARAGLRPDDRRLGRRPPRLHPRMQAAWQALGGDPERFEILIMQLVNLTEGGERVQMSKRAGTLVPLDDLLDDIGVDAARWFLLQRSHDTTLDLDLELARSAVAGQPRVLRAVRARPHRRHPAQGGRGAGRGGTRGRSARERERLHPSARSLVKRLLELPDRAARGRRPARAAPDDRLRARDRAGVLGLLPRREGGGRRRRGRRRGRAAGALRGHKRCSRGRSTCWGSRRRRRCSSRRRRLPGESGRAWPVARSSSRRAASVRGRSSRASAALEDRPGSATRELGLALLCSMLGLLRRAAPGRGARRTVRQPAAGAAPVRCGYAGGADPGVARRDPRGACGLLRARGAQQRRARRRR